MNSLPVVTVTPVELGVFGTCSCGSWRFFHIHRNVVDLQAADHRRGHATWKEKA